MSRVSQIPKATQSQSQLLEETFMFKTGGSGTASLYYSGGSRLTKAIARVTSWEINTMGSATVPTVKNDTTNKKLDVSGGSNSTVYGIVVKGYVI